MRHLQRILPLQFTVTRSITYINSPILAVYIDIYYRSDCEIQQRVKLASAAFGRLSHRVFLNHNLAIVYKSICISILLYGCESCTMYRRHIKTLEAFHIRCLKSILGIHWWHKVTHVEIRHRASDTDSAEHLLLQRQLRWACHSYALQTTPSSHTLRRISKWTAVAWWPKVAVHGPHPSYPEQVQYFYCQTETAFNRPRHAEKCLCQWLGNIQCGCRSSS